MTRLPCPRACRAVWTFLALALAACNAMEPSPPPPAAIASDAARLVDPGQIVVLAPGPRAADRLAARASAAGYRLERRDPLPALGLEQLVLRLPAGRDPQAAIRELEAMGPDITAGVNHAYRPAAEPAPRVYAPALLAWPPEGCPAAAAVGMIDGTVDASDPALTAARIVSRDVTAGQGAAVGHGTAVAALLAGPGGLGGLRLYSAAAVSGGSDPAAGVDAMVRALGWFAEEDVRIVNVSLAGPYNKILDRSLRAAADRGLVLVAAAGNDGATAPPRYPAAFAQTIAVTAIDAAMQPYARAPRGTHIDFAAPGVQVWIPAGGRGRYLSGTSLAAPFVTRLIAADPGLVRRRSAAEIRDTLAAGARDLGDAGPDDAFGLGLPQVSGPCRHS